MIKIANINENDRKALFQNTDAKMGMTDAIIEKDLFYIAVCKMLCKNVITEGVMINIALKTFEKIANS